MKYFFKAPDMFQHFINCKMNGKAAAYIDENNCLNIVLKEHLRYLPLEQKITAFETFDGFKKAKDRAVNWQTIDSEMHDTIERQASLN